MLGWLGWMGLQIPLALCGPPQAAALTGRATPLQTFALVNLRSTITKRHAVTRIRPVFVSARLLPLLLLRSPMSSCA